MTRVVGSPRRWLIGVAGAGALVVGLLAGAAVWVAGASSGRVVGGAAGVPHRPVGLVLGAAVGPDHRPSPFLAARLDLAARLVADGTVDVLLLSGDGRAGSHDEPAAMRDYLLAAGVDRGRLVLDGAGRDTYTSCARARAVFGVDALVVVSQRYHVPRAVAVCRAVGVDAVGAGDETMASFAPPVWAQGRLRELPASVKAAWDVLTGRKPVLGPPDPGVRDAVRRAAGVGASAG